MKKFKFLLVSILLILVVVLVGCKKDNYSFQNPDVDREITNHNDSLEVLTKSYYSTGLYGVNQAYKNAYYHVQQGTDECSWTSYVLTAASIIRGKGNFKLSG